MDYMPLSFDLNLSYVFPSMIGRYDKAAIEYGYVSQEQDALLSLADGTVVELASSEKLQDIANKAGPFATDEDLDLELDPMVAIFDISEDPLAYVESSLSQIVSLRQVAMETHHIERANLIQHMLTGHLVYLVSGIALKFVGGRIGSKRGLRFGAHSWKPVSLQQQKRALDLIMDVLVQKEWYFPNASWSKRSGDCEPGFIVHHCYGIDFVDARNHTIKAQTYILESLLKPERLRRVQTSDNPLTLGYLLGTIRETLFGRTAFGHRPNWELQRRFLIRLVDYVNMNVHDGLSYDQSWMQAAETLAQIQTMLEQKVKGDQGLHARNCLKIIQGNTTNMHTR